MRQLAFGPKGPEITRPQLELENPPGGAVSVPWQSSVFSFWRRVSGGRIYRQYLQFLAHLKTWR